MPLSARVQGSTLQAFQPNFPNFPKPQTPPGSSSDGFWEGRLASCMGVHLHEPIAFRFCIFCLGWQRCCVCGRGRRLAGASNSPPQFQSCQQSPYQNPCHAGAQKNHSGVCLAGGLKRKTLLRLLLLSFSASDVSQCQVLESPRSKDARGHPLKLDMLDRICVWLSCVPSVSEDSQ